MLLCRFQYNEYILLVAVTSATFVAYMIRAVHVINAFCHFLNIRCLVIPHHPKPVLPVTTEAESLLASNGSNYNTI